jgi:hypothetical protein
MSKPAPSTTMRNSTCRTFGHDWKLSLGQTYRTCQREKCKAAERLVNGTWIEATRSGHPRTRQRTLDVVAPAQLWTTPLDAPHDTHLPYPGYDKHRERQLEQRYYKAIADEQYYRATHSHHQRGGH